MTAERYGVQIKLERGYLDGTVLAPKTAVPGVLFVHGWGGSQEQYLERARQAVALGCLCLTFDLTGHGRTQDEQQKGTREAILQVQQAFREWNRYALADSRDKADLVIVVRKGHAVGDQDHLGLGPHPALPQPGPLQPGQDHTMQAHPIDQNASVGTGGDDIAMQDLLRVYTLNEKGKLKGPVWSREMDGGLNGPTVRLVMELKAAVEITYPREAAAPQAPAPPTQ